MDALRWLAADAGSRFVQNFSAGSPYGAPSIAGALLFTFAWFAWRRRSRGRKVNGRAFLRAIFSKRVWLHPSSLVDMRLWALNALVLASGYAMLVAGALFWRDRMAATFTMVFGAHAPLGVPPMVAVLISTFAELLAYEFAYWAAHYAFHRIPWLWPFHKVHHSAEVMTVFTEMRQHPVEILAFMNAIALATGWTFGVTTYVFGPGVGHITLMNGNIVLMLFLLTWGHLRHSHLWVPFQGVMGRLFQSPAHHQVHHSTDPRHFDRNLGFALAVWDWVFGTLHVPARECEVAHFGVDDHQEDYQTVGRNLTLPFVRAGEALGVHAPAAEPAKGSA